MFFPSTPKTNKGNSHRRMRPLRCENLENRELLATTYMILDFTPDSHAGSFVDTFVNTRLPDSPYAPNFLDFNRDGWVNSTDAKIAAQRVANRVAGFFGPTMRGYDVHVRYGDIASNSDWGTRFINYGRSSATRSADSPSNGVNPISAGSSRRRISAREQPASRRKPSQRPCRRARSTGQWPA